MIKLFCDVCEKDITEQGRRYACGETRDALEIMFIESNELGAYDLCDECKATLDGMETSKLIKELITNEFTRLRKEVDKEHDDKPK